MMKEYAMFEDERREMRLPVRHRIQNRKERFVKRYGILLAAAALFTIYTICLSAIVDHNAEKRTWEEADAKYAGIAKQAVDDYKAEQMKASGAFLSGAESREAYIQREDVAVAEVISKLATDQQKLTAASCMVARVMNPGFANTFAEVAAQPQQWPLYDGSDKTYSQHDLELADSIVRPYLESGIIPNGLTAEMVFGSWSPNDFVLRDSYQNSATMHTWRYQG